MKLYWLTLPGLDMRSDWRVVHDRLLDDFPAVDDVLPTTMVATLLVVYRGLPQADRWIDSINDAVTRAPRVPRHETGAYGGLSA